MKIMIENIEPLDLCSWGSGINSKYPQCLESATYRIDGDDYCNLHAAIILIFDGMFS